MVGKGDGCPRGCSCGTHPRVGLLLHHPLRAEIKGKKKKKMLKIKMVSLAGRRGGASRGNTDFSAAEGFFGAWKKWIDFNKTWSILIILKDKKGTVCGDFWGGGVFCLVKKERKRVTSRLQPSAGSCLAPKILAFPPKIRPVSRASSRGSVPILISAQGGFSCSSKAICGQKSPTTWSFAPKKSHSGGRRHPKKSLKQGLAPKKVLKTGGLRQKRGTLSTGCAPKKALHTAFCTQSPSKRDFLGCKRTPKKGHSKKGSHRKKVL